MLLCVCTPACMYAYPHTRMHVCMFSRMSLYVRVTSKHACMCSVKASCLCMHGTQTHMCVCARVCVCVHVQADRHNVARRDPRPVCFNSHARRSIQSNHESVFIFSRQRKHGARHASCERRLKASNERELRFYMVRGSSRKREPCTAHRF